jgi:predicted metal-dependent HD superfamily phosphohydrolase
MAFTLELKKRFFSFFIVELDMIDNSSANILATRFHALWARNQKRVEVVDSVGIFEELLALYSEPGRYYHECTHLANCLQQFDKASHLMQMPDALELALWFHDAVYLPGAKDNESQSAKLFSIWGNIAFTPEFVEKICRLIFITMHKSPPQDIDESYIADIDLSSFGSDWPIFWQDTLNVRKEQGHLTDEIYHRSHARFLNMLLDRPYIFYSEFFRLIYEEPARRNIARLLATPSYLGVDLCIQ